MFLFYLACKYVLLLLNFLLIPPSSESSLALVLVCSVTESLAAVTKSHRLGDLNRNLFLTVLKLESPSLRCKPVWFLVRSLLEQLTSSLHPHMAEETASSLVSVNKDTIS